jgi:arginase family enzyme
MRDATSTPSKTLFGMIAQVGDFRRGAERGVAQLRQAELRLKPGLELDTND